MQIPDLNQQVYFNANHGRIVIGEPVRQPVASWASELLSTQIYAGSVVDEGTAVPQAHTVYMLPRQR